MKKRRILLFFTCFILVFFLIFLTSSLFVLQSVELCLYQKNNNSTFTKVNAVNTYNLSSIQSQIGTSIFNVKKEVYIKPFEEDNPSYKILNVEIKFPNKIVFNVIKRQELFYITNNKEIFILDEDFKIIKKGNINTYSTENLIEIAGKNSNKTYLNYFEFFDVSTSFYYEGYFLKENNLLIKLIKNFYNIVSNVNIELNIFKNMLFVEVDNTCNLHLKTNNLYGIELIIENIENNFNYKFLKVLNAFLTLEKKDKIKTTYGFLKIDNNLNCSFLEYLSN